MPDYMSPLFAEHEARARAEVLWNTFGHLEAEPGRTYQGWMLFARSAYESGNVFPIDTGFAGMNGGPFFYEHMNEWLDDNAPKEVGVYRWEGAYRVFKNGGYRFTGRIATVLRPPEPASDA